MDYSIKADFGLNAVSGSVTTLPAGYAVGDKRTEPNNYGGISYELVYNNGNSAVDKGMICYSTSTVGTQYSVTITSVTETILGVRGCNANATAATGAYFWMATNGYPVHLLASNISLGTGALIGPAAAGKAVTTDTAAYVFGTCPGLSASGTATTDANGTVADYMVWFDEVRTPDGI